ncbi:phospholipid/cholesterol/gamma-HCH transport system ATP-binding protein [Amaricoccus macauensis]|uniref:Phospholipid/cholesterol/gamma-HCH transport system ATP-binding protein n=1 Tax=Amaricoccus macauensis TaxID=57001 RepID=A0A840SLS6_9RHOB|nr:ATP-binding cassette domain-containing protein [Amaricoccus macauensis]MBB5220816.1 phospholipid/cholesterol/gamma-HCH transport system ATP-binding protein [Amaricoccus macauensis]
MADSGDIALPDTSTPGVPRIELRDVKKRFGHKRVLNGVSFKVMPGESLVIIGGSGTGKSVTLKCILGIIRCDSGQILLDGQPDDSSDRRTFLKQFGMLFQGGALFDSLSVWQNVAFRLRHARRPMPRKEARERAIEKLRRVGLGPETADLYPAELSGGMQKRVGLARAIATDPRIIFFDEPTAGLDPIMAGVINDLIRELVTEMGATAVTITHDMTTVRTVADHVAMLHDGKVQWFGRIEDMDSATDPYLDQFIHGRATGPIAAIR